MAHKLTEQDGRRALEDHVRERAMAARARYGPLIDADVIARLLDDREVVRYPVGLGFDSAPLDPGEFATVSALGEHPRHGFKLFIHPALEQRPDLLPLVIAYYIPPVNYGEIATANDCELFGATLLGMDVDSYYQKLCGIADSIPATGRE